MLIFVLSVVKNAAEKSVLTEDVKSNPALNFDKANVNKQKQLIQKYEVKFFFTD